MGMIIYFFDSIAFLKGFFFFFCFSICEVASMMGISWTMGNRRAISPMEMDLSENHDD
jgi:hypothetical protein